MNAREETREVVARLAGLPADRLTDERPLSDLATDSLALVEMVVALQVETGTRLDHERLADVTSVGDLLDALAPASPGVGTGAAPAP